MSSVVNPLDPGRRPRAGFGTLTAGMVLRGVVPAQVMYGSLAPKSERPVDRSVERLVEKPVGLPRLPEPQCILPADTAAAAAAPVAVPASTAPAGETAAEPRRAMTLRLEPVHHMRLRVVASFLKRPAQQIIVAALEEYFAQLPATVPGNCACLAAGRRPAPK